MRRSKVDYIYQFWDILRQSQSSTTFSDFLLNLLMAEQVQTRKPQPAQTTFWRVLREINLNLLYCQEGKYYKILAEKDILATRVFHYDNLMVVCVTHNIQYEKACPNWLWKHAWRRHNFRVETCLKFADQYSYRLHCSFLLHLRCHREL